MAPSRRIAFPATERERRRPYARPADWIPPPSAHVALHPVELRGRQKPSPKHARHHIPKSKSCEPTPVRGRLVMGNELKTHSSWRCAIAHCRVRSVPMQESKSRVSPIPPVAPHQRLQDRLTNLPKGA